MLALSPSLWDPLLPVGRKEGVPLYVAVSRLFLGRHFTWQSLVFFSSAGRRWVPLGHLPTTETPRVEGTLRGRASFSLTPTDRRLVPSGQSPSATLSMEERERGRLFFII